jgi:hypothetical protein
MEEREGGKKRIHKTTNISENGRTGGNESLYAVDGNIN